ncbi:MAG: hypothetical protein ACXVB1_09855 [Pseudobdellovibrionaceae bacterium]
MNKNTNKKITMGVCSMLLLACAPIHPSADSTTSNATTLASTTQAQIKVNMQVLDNTNKVIYSDANSTSSLVLKANQNYNLVLNPSQEVAGLSYSLSLNKTSAIGSLPTLIPLQSGANDFMVSSQGDYSLKLVVSAPKMLPLTKYYTANVTCPNPTFTANTLDASKISVSSAGANNIFNLSAAGVAAGANGMAPYTCAWDGTGVGIIDTAFGDCNTAVSGFYNNLVSTRKVYVVVKDACNTVYTVSKEVNYAYQVPAMGAGNVFIFGQVSNASGSAKNDARVDAATYLATNVSPGHNIVQSNYGGSGFTISAAQNYGMASSVSYGMTVQVSNLTGSVDLVNMTSTLSAANAKIKSVNYSTDQAGDSMGAVSFSGSNCTISNQNLKVQFVQGTPCSGGTGSGNKATVEVWGNYSCTSVSNATGSTTINGSFDGLDDIVDSCSGGGGGGGGVPPVSF